MTQLNPRREFFSVTAFRVSSEDNSSLDLMLVDRLDFGLLEAEDIVTCMDRRIPLSGNCYAVSLFTSHGAVVSLQLTTAGRLTLLFVQRVVKGQFTKCVRMKDALITSLALHDKAVPQENVILFEPRKPYD